MPKRVRARTKGVKGYISALRPNWLSNPFTLKEFSLEDSLYHFEDYLRSQLKDCSCFAKKFDSIPEDSTIGCTCELNDTCHVDIIINIWNERNE